MTMTKRYTVKSGKREHLENTRDAIRNKENFRTGGGLAGGRLYHERMVPSIGRLNGSARAQWESDVNRIRYVVLSYDTPIAWWVQTCECSLNHELRGHWDACDDREGRWVIVDQFFSTTTRIHQNVVRDALA